MALPTFANLDYRAALQGSNSGRQFLDVYLPEGDPPPGGWPSITHFNLSGFINSTRAGEIVEGDRLWYFLSAGIAVVDVELTPAGDANAVGGGMFRKESDPEYDLDGAGDDTAWLDAVWASQYVHQWAGAWGLNAYRMAATGYSAGAQVAFWVGGKEDQADPGNPVMQRRASSRFQALIGYRIQTWQRAIVGTVAAGGPQVNCTFLRDAVTPTQPAGDFQNALTVDRQQSSVCSWFRALEGADRINGELPIYCHGDGVLGIDAITPPEITYETPDPSYFPTFNATATTGIVDRHDPVYVAWLINSVRGFNPDFHGSRSRLTAAALWDADGLVPDAVLPTEAEQFADQAKWLLGSALPPALSADVVGEPAEYSEEQVSAYRNAALALLPPGAWRRDPDSTTYRVLEALSVAVARVHRRALDAAREADPRTALETLAAWERNYGLPGPCDQLAPTIAMRQAALAAQVRSQGGQSAAFFLELAEVLGYQVEIEEPSLFRVGVSVMGDRLYSGDWAFTWIVHAPAASPVFFRAGASVAGESLAAWSNEELECVFQKLRPAHTVVVFSYDLPPDPDGYGPWEAIQMPAITTDADVVSPVVYDIIP